MAGKKNPNLGDKLRQEREGAENTLRDSRSKTADSSTGDSSKKKAEHRRQIRHEADLAKMRSKKLKSEQEVKAKKNEAASGKKGGKPKKPGNLAADAISAKAHQSVRNADQDNKLTPIIVPYQTVLFETVPFQNDPKGDSYADRF